MQVTPVDMLVWSIGQSDCWHNAVQRSIVQLSMCMGL